jgi:membrane-associated phospholipid phosphatase
MKIFSTLVVFCVQLSVCFGQTESPYIFNWKRELIYASGAGLVAGGGLLSSFQTQPLTIAQINSLDKFNIPGFDRTATNKWNPKANLASDIFVYGSVALPGFMMINKRMRKDFLVIGFIYAETAMLTLGVTELTKGLAKRARPFVYNPDVAMSEKTSRSARHSFFSWHTSMTSAICFTTAKIFSDYSDNRTHEALVWTGAVIVPAVTGILRYESGQHFPSDIIAGYFVGATIGYLVPWLHKRKPLTKGLTISPYGIEGGAGLYLSYRL